jgi:ribosomal protein S18
MNLYFNEEDAIEELKERGYRITKEEFSDVDSITSMKSLVEFFYARRKYYNPDRKYPFSIDYKADTRVLSNFVKSREKLGLSRKAAVKESAILIDALFKYEPQLRLKVPILSLGILTSRPLMDRVCALAGGEVGEVLELETAEYVDGLNELYDKEFGQQDFENAAKERQEIMEKINGSKERK